MGIQYTFKTLQAINFSVAQFLYLDSSDKEEQKYTFWALKKPPKALLPGQSLLLIGK